MGKGEHLRKTWRFKMLCPLQLTHSGKNNFSYAVSYRYLWRLQTWESFMNIFPQICVRHGMLLLCQMMQYQQLIQHCAVMVLVHMQYRVWNTAAYKPEVRHESDLTQVVRLTDTVVYCIMYCRFPSHHSCNLAAWMLLLISFSEYH
jgi:hypothetical protein